MLDLFRRKKSGLKWTLWIVIVALSGGMVLLFVQTPGGVNTGLSNRDVAVVAGDPITATQFRRRYNQVFENFRKIYQLDQQDPSVLRQLDLGRRTLDELISERVVWYESQNMGIEIAAEEVREYIRNFPAFQEDGRFIGTERYRQVLRASSLSTAEFETEIRRALAQEKLLRILTDGIHATATEVRQEFVDRNQGVKIRYVVMDPKIIGPEKVDDAEVRAFFEENSQNYQTSERRRVKYVEVTVDPETVEITEEQIQNRMALMDEREAVRASHILITVDDETPEAQARSQAEALLEEIRKGANFAELAKEHSTDRVSAKSGGDLGFFERGQMVPEFERAAFALEPGQLSGLVKSTFGFHIIKATDVRLADRRPAAESELHQAEAQKLARNLATKIIYEARRSPNLETAAARYNKECKETAFFALGDVVEGLNVRSDFNQQVFTLTPGQLMEQPYTSGITSIVSQLEEIEPAASAQFDTVKTRVVEDYKSNRGEALSREKAFAFFQAVQGGEGFQRAALKQRVKVTTSDFVKRGSRLGDLGETTEILERARGMKSGETSPPVTVAGKYVVFELVERSQIDEEQFEEEKSNLLEQLTTQKRNQFFSAWMKNVGERLRNEQRIRENPELVDSIAG